MLFYYLERTTILYHFRMGITTRYNNILLLYVCGKMFLNNDNVITFDVAYMNMLLLQFSEIFGRNLIVFFSVKPKGEEKVKLICRNKFQTFIFF